ncbi:MAG: hypothetical protein IMY72_07725 [Bacteroidetes bacterium]|nr:hypothetical protein [Bacteroidota bacterium]
MNLDDNINDNNLLDKLNEITKNIPGKLNILNEPIDINVQIEYFEYSKKIKEKNNSINIIIDIKNLFEKETSIEEKKQLIASLASQDNVKSYRTLEKYSKSPDKELKNWSLLALQESRMLIEGSILEENQIFISTGLGGKDSKLRYFVVFFAKNKADFSDIQKKIITKELKFTLKHNNAEIEKIKFDKNFSTILSLIPIQEPIEIIFKDVIRNCNELGNFINDDFLITNTKVMNKDEVENYLNNKKNA